ncbi:caspase family protein [Larkinella humicola]|uniref:Caspase family p20 domain-containing protein n=1 Tax=Larkinella humicola TaxID=2607654 RepID=A0A5N1JGJ1_9BACT|nr:caspase family protein [Larkinella humicola]KAA9349849.1 hypothetical protein F0P93_20625 [Larkinella humicola]
MKRFFWLISLLALPGLAQVTDLSKSPLAGHVGTISSTAYNPDGSLVASGGYDNTIKLWDFKSGKVVKTLTGHSGIVYAIRFYKNGKFLVSGSSDKTLKIWDWQSGKMIKSIPSDVDPYFVELVDNDRLIISVSWEENAIKLIDAQTGKLVRTLFTHLLFGSGSGSVSSISYDSSTNRLALGISNNTVGIIDLKTGKAIRSFNPKEDSYYPVESVSFSEDGKKIASAHDNVVKIWDVNTGKLLRSFINSSKNIETLQFANSDHSILCGSREDTVNVWDATTGLLQHALPLQVSFPTHTLTLNSDRTQAIASDTGSTESLVAWDIKSGKTLQNFRGLNPLISKTFSGDFDLERNRIALGISAGKVGIWNPSTGDFSQLLEDKADDRFETRSTHFSPDGTLLAAAALDTIRIWNLETGKAWQLPTGAGIINAVRFSKDGSHLISELDNRRFQILTLRSRSKFGPLFTSTYQSPDLPQIRAIGVGNNPGELVLATGDNTLRLWNTAENKATATVPVNRFICNITYTPNDRYVVVQGFDNLIEIRDAKTLKLIQTLDQVGFFTDANFKAPQTPDGLYEIYPYFRSVFLKKVAGQPVVAAPPKTALPPTITWELPTRSDETVANNAYGVKACITGDGITAHQLYLNGEPVSLRGFKRLGCPLGIDQVITLRIGPNELYLTATTAAGTVSSERRYITYQPPAPSPLTVQTAPQQKRLALVIGNARYQHAGSLANPVNDALALKAVLEECGFTVLYYADLDKKGMITAFQEFGLKLKAYNVGLVFYAGHGLSIRGMNYFLPTDANPQSEDEVEFEGIPTTRLVRKMEEANRLTNIILFDACRDNPFARTWGRALGESGGFALLPPPKGTLIAYAASDGEPARDRAKTGTNSPFTKALVKYIRQGGLSLSQILQRVRTDVENETAERQTTQDVNMMRDDFYFR